MTELTLQEAFKSKAKFSELMCEETPTEVNEVLSQYPKSDGKVIIQVAELTQNFETLLNALGSSNIPELPKAPYLVWIVTNEKENVMNVLKTINNHATDGFGIFVFKAILNEDKIGFECLLKPEVKTARSINTETPAKLLQKKYWEQYFEICDTLASEMQITPAPRHYQYISVGKAGVQIVQTTNTKDKYIATELFINSNQGIFEKLFENKNTIEKELGELDWQPLEGKKSSRIRKTYYIDISVPENEETAINEHIKMAENFKTTFNKYL